MESAFAWRRATGERETGWRKHGVSLVSGMILWYHVTCLLLSGQTVWRRDVRDVAVPLGFARPWWKVRLRGAVPLGSARKRGVSLVSRMICGIKSVPKECPARASYKSDPQECPTRVSQIECPTRVSRISVPQECPKRVSRNRVQKSVSQECP